MIAHLKADNEVYVVSDIHGAYKDLKRLLKPIPQSNFVIFAGDMVNGKGEYCDKKVIELIRNRENYLWIWGNHELLRHIYNLSVEFGHTEDLDSYNYLVGKHKLDLDKPLFLVSHNTTLIGHLPWIKNYSQLWTSLKDVLYSPNGKYTNFNILDDLFFKFSNQQIDLTNNLSGRYYFFCQDNIKTNPKTYIHGHVHLKTEYPVYRSFRLPDNSIMRDINIAVNPSLLYSLYSY